MNPADLALFLNGLIQNRLKLSTMIWGPPGIGKSRLLAEFRRHQVNIAIQVHVPGCR